MMTLEGLLTWLSGRKEPQVVRGTKRVKTKPFRSSKQRTREHRYLWGGEFLSFEQARKHFLAVGSTGSGKTVTISLLMKTVLERLAKQNSNVRALVYDGKTDLLSSIRGMGVKEEDIMILNPLDARCYAWDMAQDIQTAAEADDVSSLLIPVSKGEQNPYFPDTARRLLSGVIEAFQENASHWTLRDLILACIDTGRLRAVLESSEETRELTEHFEPLDTFRNVKSTLNSLRDYRVIAASWHRAMARGKAFSAEDWLYSQKVMVLGNSPKAKSAIRRINQLLFSVIVKEILDRPGKSDAENWIFLDEFRELGKLDLITDLMITGRSKGAAVVLGFQDIAGLDHEYSRDLSREVIGCTQNLSVLHINSTQPDTQRWVSEVLGKHQVSRRQMTEQQSRGRGGGSTGTNTSERLSIEDVWLPSQFATELPPMTPEDGLVGLFRANNTFTRHTISGELLFTDKGTLTRILPPSKDFPDRIPVDRKRLSHLPDWDAEDLQRLGLPRELLRNSKPEQVGDLLDYAA